MPLASFQAVEKNGPAVYFEGVEVKDLMTHQAPGIHPGGGLGDDDRQRRSADCRGQLALRARLCRRGECATVGLGLRRRVPVRISGRGSRPPHDSAPRPQLVRGNGESEAGLRNTHASAATTPKFKLRWCTCAGRRRGIR